MNPPDPKRNPQKSSEELEFNFQSLNLSHKGEVQIDFEEENREQVLTPFNRLFKAGPPEGKPARNVSLFMFERSMRAAWRSRYFKAKELVPNLFMVHFRTEDDLRLVCQRQPWIVERETMLVEWVDPSGDKPMSSYTFRYLPVTMHLYGIPKSLRSMDLVEKIIQRIGAKDNSVVFSESSLFRIPEYVIACVILDVRKPLLDSIIISISKEKKIKVFIYYEKIVKICNFCGYLFHNVSSCTQRHMIIRKLDPSEAAKVPEEIYGKWRTLEYEIPIEAKEDKDSKSKDSFIQSFRDYFQKNLNYPLAATSQEEKNSQEGGTSGQLMLSPYRYETISNAVTTSEIPGNLRQGTSNQLQHSFRLQSNPFDVKECLIQDKQIFNTQMTGSQNQSQDTLSSQQAEFSSSITTQYNSSTP